MPSLLDLLLNYNPYALELCSIIGISFPSTVSKSTFLMEKDNKALDELSKFVLTEVNKSSYVKQVCIVRLPEEEALYDESVAIVGCIPDSDCSLYAHIVREEWWDQVEAATPWYDPLPFQPSDKPRYLAESATIWITGMSNPVEFEEISYTLESPIPLPPGDEPTNDKTT